MNARAGNSRRRDRPDRRGYGLVEVAMAVLLLMVAMNLMVKVLGLVGVERRAADRRLWAIEAASNLMERVTAEPFDGVTASKARSFARESGADRVLPGAAWEVSVEDQRGGPVPAKRVSVRLRWTDRSGDRGAPVRLTAWVFRGGKGS